MFGKAMRILTGNREEPSSAAGAPPVPVAFPRGGLAKLINPAGRVNLVLLQRLANAVPKDDFIRYMQAPSLVGSAIHLGNLQLQPKRNPLEMSRTVLFEPQAGNAEAASASDSLKHAIYPLVRSEFATGGGGFYTVGRIDGNSLIMPDYAISKKHAVIENKRGLYFLKDLGSTNGSTLNGARVKDKPVELHDRDILAFARYEFAFLFPATLHETLRPAAG